MKIKVEKLARVRLHPNDVLVLRTDASAEVLFEMGEQLKAIFPNNKTIVLTPGADLEVVRGSA